MNKSTIVTSVASLLTFASVAVLPAFALDTGGVQRGYNGQGSREPSVSKSYHSKKSEEFSRYRGDRERSGDRERYGKHERHEHDGSRWGHGKHEHRGDHDGSRWGHGKQDERGGQQYGSWEKRDRGYYGSRSYASR